MAVKWEPCIIVLRSKCCHSAYFSVSVSMSLIVSVSLSVSLCLSLSLSLCLTLSVSLSLSQSVSLSLYLSLFFIFFCSKMPCWIFRFSKGGFEGTEPFKCVFLPTLETLSYLDRDFQTNIFWIHRKVQL